MSNKKDMLGPVIRVLVTVPKSWLGTILDLVNKLAGSETDEWFAELVRFLRKEPCWVVRPFEIFKTIKLGTHKLVDDLRQSLKDNGNRISDWGNDILGKTTLAESETEVTLHVATVKELTGKDCATNREINEAIRSKGYNLCPAEVGPQLRLQYPDQPKGEWLRVAMKPIAGSDGGLSIFRVEHGDDGRWLDGLSGHPGDGWSGGSRFVFVSRK
jgi:hypothetical protein